MTGAAEALAALVEQGRPRLEMDKPYAVKAAAFLEEARRRYDLAAGAGGFDYYIRPSDPASIPFLVAALNAHGHRRMGNALLNCGQPTLQDAARAWGTSQGYTIETMRGGSSRRWSSR